MNNEVIKAMNRKPRKNTAFKKWWKKNRYIVMRIILFPIWACVWCYQKINPWLNSRNSWDENRANKILNYYIPRCAKWNSEDKTFYLYDNGYGWSMATRKYIKLKDRRFWKLHTIFFGGEMRDYLINSFELDGFTKEIADTDVGSTEITFTIK
jgi:hypothetical protein